MNLDVKFGNLSLLDCGDGTFSICHFDVQTNVRFVQYDYSYSEDVMLFDKCQVCLV